MQMLGNVAGSKRSEAEIRDSMKEWLNVPQQPGLPADFQRKYSYFPTIPKPIIANIHT